MGKRKQKLAQKPKSLSSSSTDSFENICESDSAILIQEINESLSGIYREYLKDLKIRRDKRLAQKNPAGETQLYNLIINPKYRVSLKAKIQHLIESNYTCRLKNIIDEVLESFIDNLKDFVKEAEDKSRILQLVYLHETFHSLQNSVSEISKILIELYSFEQFSFISLHKFHFGVMNGKRKLITFAKTQDSCHFAVASVVKMCENLDKLVKTGECKAKDIMFEVGSDLDESIEEPIHSLPLEDLVNYINGSPLSIKKNKSSKKLVENSELDLEIDEFQKRLVLPETPNPRPLPFCSQDFLGILRTRYLEVRKKLLNN